MLYTDNILSAAFSRFLLLALLATIPSNTFAQRITFAGMGDIFFGRAGQSYGSDDPFRHVKHLIQGRDIVYGNLETPIVAKRSRVLDPPCYISKGTCKTKDDLRYRRLYYLTFQARVDSARILSEAGFTVMGTANNHAEDQKAVGMLETIEHLRAKNVDSAGTGLTPADAWKPYVFEKEGVSVGLIAVTAKWNYSPSGFGAYYANSSPFAIIKELPPRVRELKTTVDFVIVAVHIGVEDSGPTTALERKLTRKLSQAGADLFVGSHPHVLRGVEIIDQMVAVWSLGNFLFDHTDDKWGESAILHVDFVKSGSRRYMDNIYLHPVTLDGAPEGIPQPAKPFRAKKIIGDIFRLSKQFRNSPGKVLIKDGKILVNPTSDK